jgi:hypothetical protein
MYSRARGKETTRREKSVCHLTTVTLESEGAQLAKNHMQKIHEKIRPAFRKISHHAVKEKLNHSVMSAEDFARIGSICKTFES